MTTENENETESQEIDEPVSGETPQESARAVWDELQAALPDEDEQEKKAAPKDEKEIDPSEAGRALAKSKKGKKRQTFVPADTTVGVSPTESATDTQAPHAEKWEPPQHWDVENKEWFNRQDPTVQKEALKWFRNAQAKTTQVLQELNQERQNVQEIQQVADKYLEKLDTRGMSRAQVVEQLFQYQQQINEDDVGAIIEMMQHRNLTLQDLHDRVTSGIPAKKPAQQTEKTYLTQEEFDRRLEERERTLAQQRATESATEEVRSLIREMDAQGKYVYPELHNPQYVQGIQHLINHVRANNPSASWREVYQQAVLLDRQARGATNGTPSAALRLTPQEIQNVTKASSSLRSRGGNGAIPRMADPKPGETAQESARAAYYEVFGDKQH